MKKWFYLSIAYFSWLTLPCQAQMIDGQDTLYGPEWINYDQTYYKIKVAADGIYRLSYQTLVAAGFPVNQITAAELQLFCLGQEQPLYTTTEGILSAEDYLEFYGRQNRTELDRFLFRDAENEMLNPDYSLITDTAVYFLTSSPGNHLRYQTITGSPGTPDTLEWYWHEEKVVFSEAHFKPTVNDDGVRLSDYVPGEGFGTTPFQTRTISIPASGYIANLHPPRLSFRLAGRNKEHEFTVTHNLAQRFVKSAPHQMVIEDLELSQVFAENNFQFNTTTTNDRLVLGSITLNYPRRAEFIKLNNFHLSLPDFYPRSILSVKASAGEALLVYDQKARQRQVLTDQRGKFCVHLQAAKSPLILTQNIISVPQIEKIVFHKLDHTGINYVFITSSKFQPEVQAYSQYRQSEAGGNYSTQVIYVEDLYDQYAYGQPVHPLSIKNWANHTAQNHQIDFALFIGKGFQYPDVRNKTAKGFLPVFGLPGSQQLLVSSGYSTIPHFAHGLLSATEGADINNYLTKVQDLEQILKSAPQTIEDRAWMKRVLHMAAGGPASETELLSSYLSEMGEILINNNFGSTITTFNKTSSTETVEGYLNENIFNLINTGVAIKSYFGHGAATLTLLDSYDHPNIFKNYQRYPLMISLGCFTGNAFFNGISLSEENVFIKDKGALGFIATSGLGFISALREFGTSFYSDIGSNYFGEGIGISINSFLKKFQNINNVQVLTLKQQLVYQGDPAIKLNYHQQPDYIIDPSSFKTNKANLDSVEIFFDVVNLGINVTDSLKVKVIHTLPENERNIEYVSYIISPVFQHKVHLKIKTQNKSGLHKLSVVLNEDGKMTEGPLPDAVVNNTFSYEFFVDGLEAFPAIPEEFAIVNQLPVDLYGCTINAFSPKQKYIFQLDTTALFNNPLANNITADTQGCFKWIIDNLPFKNEVYYWRIKPFSGGHDTWQTSSFLYNDSLPNGWNQSHIYQYKRNQLEGFEVNSNLIYASSGSIDIYIRNKNFENNAISVFNINGTPRYEAQDTRNFPCIALTIFDENGRFFKNPVGMYLNNFQEPITTHYFKTRSLEERKKFIGFLKNVPENYTVILYPIREPNANFNSYQWASDSIVLGENIFSILEKRGAKKIRDIVFGDELKSYTLIYNTSNNNIIEHIGNSPEDVVITEYKIQVIGETGTMTTLRIGPSSRWDEVIWRDRKSGLEDVSSISIYAVNNYYQDSLLNISEEEYFGLNALDQEQYPYLKLVYRSEDTINYTPPGIEHIRVLYEGIGDLSIEPGRINLIDTINKSNEYLFYSTNIKNIGNFSMDSFNVLVEFKDEANHNLSDYYRFGGLKKNEQTELKINKNLKDLKGKCQLIIRLNPEQKARESSFKNNIAIKEFYAEENKIKPLLDVTVNGKHIQYGEVINTTPEIIIQVTKGSILEKYTKQNFYLTLINPDEQGAEINISNERHQFLEEIVTDSEYRVKLLWLHSFNREGIYKLRVNIKTNEGALISDLQTELVFKIILHPTVQVKIFPNPFQTYTTINILFNDQVEMKDFCIYNAIGQKVYCIEGEANKRAYTILWPEITPNANISAGIYYYKLAYFNKVSKNTETVVGRFQMN